jgi:hypothetical protein
MAFVGDPPLWRPEADELHISVTFTWDVREATRLLQEWRHYYPVVKIGGPAYGGCSDGFTPGLYVKPGVTFTSRGCNNDCPWCLVSKREGRLALLPIMPGWIINDNNFLQTPRLHRMRVYEMLAGQKQGAVFAGGLQASLVTEEIAAEFRDIRIRDVFLAADTERALGPLERAVSRLSFLGRERMRCYVLVGWNGETIEDAERRLRRVWEIGAMPFAQLYQPEELRKVEYGSEWKALQKTWSRPAAMKAEMKRSAS